MKKIKTYYQHLLITFSIIVIVSCVCAVKQASAQAGPAATAIDEIKPLKIGDKVPDELWDQYFPVVSAGNDQTQMLKLGDYQDKLIILDFWATWCAPCISSLGKLDTLQKEFKDDLMIIPTSYEPEEKVRSFFADKGWQLPTLFNETLLKAYFPYQTIPHQVWLKDGKVFAISNHQYTNNTNIKKVLEGQDVIMPVKPFVEFDSSLPLLIDGNGGNRDRLLYQSIITKMIDINSSGRVPINNKGFLFYNGTALTLLKEAFSNISTRPNRVIYEISDSLMALLDFNDRKRIGVYERDREYDEWLSNYTFCYNLTSSAEMEKEKIYRIMQNDLNNYFSVALEIYATVEERTMDCWILKKTGNIEDLITKGETGKYKYDKDSAILINRHMGYLIEEINSIDPKKIMIDETGIKDNIDMIFPHTVIVDIKTANNFLDQYGLTLVNRKMPVEMIVIKENKERGKDEAKH